MALTNRKNLLKSLHVELPHGAPFDVHQLKAMGISSALASHYLRAGWVGRLGRGVFSFPKDELQRDACLLFLAGRHSGLHVGGKTALAWRGVRHNLSAVERLCLWGSVTGKLPEWFTERFPSDYVARKLFAGKLPVDFGLQPLPENPSGPLVSVPERALLEMLSEVGIRQGVEEARNIMEGIRSLRMDVLTPLLKNCLRIKVVRLCVQWSEELGLNWAPEARKAAQRKMGKHRWMTRLKDGRVLILKP